MACKIAVKVNNNTDVVGAIFGSSNLTNTILEYSEQTNKWNAEVDVLYWDASYDTYMDEYNKFNLLNTDNGTGAELNVLPISVNGGNNLVRDWLLNRAIRIKETFLIYRSQNYRNCFSGRHCDKSLMKREKNRPCLQKPKFKG